MELAIYAIRSKQDYIYKTNRVVEIVGASEIISRAWEFLFEKAEKDGLRIQKQDKTFQFDEIKTAFENEQLDMVELFCGGGNNTVLFRDKGSFIKANKVFSYHVLKDYPGMIPMAVSVKVSGNYKDDYKKLLEKSDKEKNIMIPGRNQFILPFSIMDRDIFQPMTDMDQGIRYPKERLIKRKMGTELRDDGNAMEAIKLLDKMVTKRGEESLLAVIHADGNNMGSKISDLLGEETSYDYCVNAMRAFTADTNKAFVEDGLKAISDCQKRLMDKYRKHKGYTDAKGNLKKYLFAIRRVIADGDDMTLICNARFAMEYTRAYVQAVQEYHKDKKTRWAYSSCAGICIFHSHYSFAEAYRLAEKACDDGAKAMVHMVGPDGRNKAIEEGWVDFHYIHSGVGGDLQTIRKMQGTEGAMARPWRIDGQDTSCDMAYEKLEKLARILHEHQVSRTDIKNLGIDWENSREMGFASLQRVYGHHAGLAETIRTRLKWDDELLMKALYDFAEIYDLWFAEE